MDKETNQMPSLTGILSALESSAGLLFFFKKKIRKQPRKERSLRSFSIISTQTESQRARIGGCSSNKKAHVFTLLYVSRSFALINQTSITTYLISRHTISVDGIDLEKEKNRWDFKNPGYLDVVERIGSKLFHIFKENIRFSHKLTKKTLGFYINQQQHNVISIRTDMIGA